MISRALSLTLTIAFLLFGTIYAQLDPTFGTNGVTTASPGSAAGPIASFILPDGKIFVVSRSGCCGGGSLGTTYFFRFNSDGSPDTTYATGGFKTIAIPYSGGVTRAAVRQPDGKIVLVGRHNSADSFVARYNEDGTLDTGFRSTGYHQLSITTTQSSQDELLSVVIQSDGKILAAGYARDGTGDGRLAFVRYLANGTLDPSLGGTGITIHESARFSDNAGDQSLYVNSAGKILVANVREIGGGKLRGFNFDGSVDGGFNVIPYPFLGGFVRTISFLQPDDKILVGSLVTKNETLARTHDDVVVYRYNADGTPDAGFGTLGSVSFDITSYFSDEPLAFQMMADGHIVVTAETGIATNRAKMSGTILSYAKLSSDGTVVGKYLATNESNSLTEPCFTNVLPDGKVLTVFRAGGSMLLVRLIGIPLQTYIFHALPYNFPSAAAGVPAKPSVFRPSDATWRVTPTSTANFGQSTDIPVSGDFVGSIIPDFAFFRPSSGTWYISNNDWDGVITNFTTIQWGIAGDIPVPADYDGDGKSDVAVFRPSDGSWWIRNSSDETYRYVRWGLNGDKPAVGDFDGDGRYDISVFRPSDGNWYIIRSSDGGFVFTHFGLDGDIPVQEDYDDDEIFDIAVYRPSSGVWYRLNSSDGNFVAIQWGLPGDIPVPAEYDRDGKMNIAVWRPSNGYWYILNPDNVSMHFYIWGNPTDIPLPGKF
jgi:uncharacterized delta-60 repeat protein